MTEAELRQLIASLKIQRDSIDEAIVKLEKIARMETWPNGANETQAEQDVSGARQQPDSAATDRDSNF